ncbi:PspA/IM30 family protein [Litorihabitans aurantiacus]|uniref:Membrane protein n=1 Tax=Litorihabitans aurantiacus TaxID=1930061 RepID=A0AA37UGU0_9MICO|nr:PspA/IM30 family protein [Litorihabitans aurantiacus]GMA30363.1 membrane protein [Litorihabitans aurantiacus]
MAQKQTILGRISQLAKANINALIDRAEDPQKMLDQLIRDYTNNIVEAENAIAQTIGNTRLAQADLEEDRAAVQEWGARAAAAAATAQRKASEGNAADAERFTQLARVALGKQLEFEREVSSSEPIVASQVETAEKLKAGLAGMKDKLGQLQSKRDQLVARAKAAQAQRQVQESIGSINVLDPTSELGRWEDAVRREEAQAAGHAELAASSFESQFEALEAEGDKTEIELRLEALRNPGGVLPASGTADQITQG